MGTLWKIIKRLARKLTFGACPKCENGIMQEVYGWNKMECDRCGHIEKI